MATTAPIKMFTSWSMSRYQDHKKCPAKAKYKHLDRLPEPASEAMQRGRDIHQFAEDYITGKLKKLPVELARFKADFTMLKKAYASKTLPATAEEKWTFTKDWDQTEWNDWGGAWLRVVLDCSFWKSPKRLEVRDWKTGKMDPYKNAEYMEQLELYALAALFVYGTMSDIEIEPSIAYLDTGDVYPPLDERIVYTQKDRSKLLKTWMQRVKPMLSDKRFAPKPNPTCKWCHFSKAKGGPCKF